MSAREIRRRMIDALVTNKGLLRAETYEALIEYATEGSLTTLELRHLVAPQSYLVNSTKLRDAGLTAKELRIEDAALARAKAFAAEHGLVAQFDLFTSEAEIAKELDEARAKLATALAAGEELGDYGEWELETPGAKVRFATRAFNRAIPALVMDKPVFADPSPRDIVAERRGELLAASSLDALRERAKAILSAEATYFDADDLEGGSLNHRYGVQNSRRTRFLDALRDLTIHRAGLGLAVNALVVELRDDLIDGRRYDMEVGTHKNYWPYDTNYAGVLEKICSQLPPDSDGAAVVANRLADIYRRKSVFRGRSDVDEKNAEMTLGGCVIWRPLFGERNGHRASLTQDSSPYKPRYELLTLASEGLPEEHAALAGAKLFRDTSGGAVRFDLSVESPERTGQELPATLSEFVQVRSIDASELSVRAAQLGESLREGFSLDWREEGVISVTPIDIGWWGHCHNEAPANAMGIDPRKGVTLYRADRGVHRSAASVEYSEEDCWDLVGAFTSDHEGSRVTDPRTGRVSTPGYVLYSGGGGHTPTRVNDTSFVGNRNNGGHWFQITPEQGRRVRINAHVEEIWGLEDPSVQYLPPMKRFRRDVEHEDGSFSPNPDWVESGMADSDMIAVKAGGRKLTLETTFVTFDDGGQRVERKLQAALDPAVDDFVVLGEEIESHDRGGGGRLVEFAYNPKTRQLRSVRFESRRGGGFERRELSRRVVESREVIAVQETTYDSVAEIDQYVVEDMGLPLTFDTTSGQAVWNYPVMFLGRYVLGRVHKQEEGETFTYTTYRLSYRTMGGPSGMARYIIKRDTHGHSVRALALDPMPDFAYRNEHWVCAPLATDVRGRVAINLRGLTHGYVTDASKQNLVLELWSRQALLLYASLSEATASERAWLFEGEDGEVHSFANKDAWRAAVDADLHLRELEG